MELIWLVLALLAVDLAALVFAADTRPGFEHASRWTSRPSRRSRPSRASHHAIADRRRSNRG